MEGAAEETCKRRRKGAPAEGATGSGGGGGGRAQTKAAQRTATDESKVQHSTELCNAKPADQTSTKPRIDRLG
ncbi:hypothetical protein GUJ93_ZPchr0010g10377 [Zizania palustris]|uniref:Uncharacterized protein n=1 Tax=Zizania palustris TaxID=103762 RepID=A0A8J5W9C0_ZIZPA|nr:hypothetical protein GUJ93_ZPchr0010g10377 [Zizania palustris]